MRNLTCVIAHHQRVHAARPVNTNSLAFLVTGVDLRYLGGCIDESLFYKLYFSYLFYCVDVNSSIAVHDPKLAPNVT